MSAGPPTTEQRARTRAVAATARSLSGVALTLGMLGLLNTGLDGLTSDSAETLFVFLAHPVTALVWLIIGLVGIASAVDPVRARRFLVAVGGLLVAWALLALALGDDVSQVLTRDRAVVALHLIGGAVSLAVALAPLPDILTQALGRPPEDAAAGR